MVKNRSTGHVVKFNGDIQENRDCVVNNETETEVTSVVPGNHLESVHGETEAGRTTEESLGLDENSQFRVTNQRPVVRGRFHHIWKTINSM